MKSELLMLVAYALICAVAAGYYTIFQFTSGEAMVLAVITLTGIMYGGGAWGSFTGAVIVFAALGAISVVLFLLKAKNKKGFFSPAFVGLGCIFVLESLLLHGDYIQKIDDLHQWAASVKYMFYRGHLPVQADFIGDASQPMFTSVFHVFFQWIGGYQEGNMYTSGTLLSAVALMLPLSWTGWKKWKSAVLYTCFTYIGMYGLYLHAYKSLYVDLPVAAWGAMVCIWYAHIVRDPAENRYLAAGASGASSAKSKASSRMIVIRHLLFAFAALFAVSCIKSGIGILFVLFDAVYIAVDRMISNGWSKFAEGLRKYWKAVLLVIVVIAAGATFVFIRKGRYFVPASLDGVVEALTLSTEKARLTLATMGRMIVKLTLNHHSGFKIHALQAVIAFCVELALMGVFVKGTYRRHMIWQSIYCGLCFIGYLGALYISYVSIFSYEESVKNTAIHRYLSVIVMYIFFIFSAALLETAEELGAAKKKKIFAGIRIALLCISMTAMNKQMITDASSFRGYKISYYQTIKAARYKAKTIKELIAPEDKVYHLEQGFDLENIREFSLCVPLYDLDTQISNYTWNPWKFTENGSLTFINYSPVTIYDFPGILAGGGYTYLWINHCDDYLAQMLPQVVECEQPVESGLYKVIVKDDGGIRIEYVTEI